MLRSVCEFLADYGSELISSTSMSGTNWWELASKFVWMFIFVFRIIELFRKRLLLKLRILFYRCWISADSFRSPVSID